MVGFFLFAAGVCVTAVFFMSKVFWQRGEPDPPDDPPAPEFPTARARRTGWRWTRLK